MSQIIIGFTTEGTTDNRFLESIIIRTFVSVGFECTSQIEVITPILYIEKPNGEDFKSEISRCSINAFKKGIMVFCVHVDADNSNDAEVIQNKILPAFGEIKNNNMENICKNLIAVIPVYMTESWMLADKELLKDEIGTSKSNNELGINRRPESIANPKATIAEAIRIARSGLVRHRRRELNISELYQPIGQKIELTKLETLPSYIKFKNEVRSAYRTLGYLQ
jgi:Domain of unknown function (DUF4276)